MTKRGFHLGVFGAIEKTQDKHVRQVVGRVYKQCRPPVPWGFRGEYPRADRPEIFHMRAPCAGQMRGVVQDLRLYSQTIPQLQPGAGRPRLIHTPVASTVSRVLRESAQKRSRLLPSQHAHYSQRTFHMFTAVLIDSVIRPLAGVVAR